MEQTFTRVVILPHFGSALTALAMGLLLVHALVRIRTFNERPYGLVAFTLALTALNFAGLASPVWINVEGVLVLLATVFYLVYGWQTKGTASAKAVAATAAILPLAGFATMGFGPHVRPGISFVQLNPSQIVCGNEIGSRDTFRAGDSSSIENGPVLVLRGPELDREILVSDKYEDQSGHFVTGKELCLLIERWTDAHPPQHKG